MAERLRRAARQYYELREFEGTLQLDLGVLAECGTYDEAVEAAFDHLEQNDPQRQFEILRAGRPV